MGTQSLGTGWRLPGHPHPLGPGTGPPQISHQSLKPHLTLTELPALPRSGGWGLLITHTFLGVGAW